MTTPIRQSPYLQKQRNFPDEIEDLTNEIDKSYIDIASKVNDRTIGTFALNLPIITGESWNLSGQNPLQTLRKLFRFTNLANITHGIIQSNGYTRMYGSYTDGTNWYGITGSEMAVTNMLTFYVTSTEIVFLDGGVTAPTTGFIVLEWLSQA